MSGNAQFSGMGEDSQPLGNMGTGAILDSALASRSEVDMDVFLNAWRSSQAESSAMDPVVPISF